MPHTMYHIPHTEYHVHYTIYHIPYTETQIRRDLGAFDLERLSLAESAYAPTPF